ncbi:hypothetical protein [Nonomuraea africana]|uniref:Uncharacterized protein n=1 Tax=Nonomuraea africana TaxID=46171 RepID=A0ABR9K667_9ACTN|nr:hypothetical protein [Nonomuraea africana]MBE1557508.1 hypothetical protein [Nonomuraea africana]
MIGYALGGALGWFIYPAIALGMFLLLPACRHRWRDGTVFRKVLLDRFASSAPSHRQQRRTSGGTGEAVFLCDGNQVLELVQVQYHVSAPRHGGGGW